MSNDKPAFIALRVSAAKLIEKHIPFAVYVQEDNVHAYVVTKENWAKAENFMDGDIYLLAGSIPLLSYNKDLERTAKELNWIMIGSI